MFISLKFISSRSLDIVMHWLPNKIMISRAYCIYSYFGILSFSRINYLVSRNRNNFLYIEDMTWPQGDTKFRFECWKNISWMSAVNNLNIFEHKKRNFVAPRSHVMFYLLHKHQWNTKPLFVCERCCVLCCYSNGDLFTCEDNV